MCSHPHGTIPAGINIATATNYCGWNEKFPGMYIHIVVAIQLNIIDMKELQPFSGLDVRCCTVPINFRFFGIHRELILASGMISCTKESIEYMFR